MIWCVEVSGLCGIWCAETETFEIYLYHEPVYINLTPSSIPPLHRSICSRVNIKPEQSHEELRASISLQTPCHHFIIYLYQDIFHCACLSLKESPRLQNGSFTGTREELKHLLSHNKSWNCSCLSFNISQCQIRLFAHNQDIYTILPISSSQMISRFHIQVQFL